jgi:hypothetical protein
MASGQSAFRAETRHQVRQALAVVARHHFVDAEVLYTQWYAQPSPGRTVPPGCPPDLTETFRAAHRGFLHWEAGWQVVQVGPRGEVLVRRDAELRMLERCDYAPVGRRGLLPRPGDEVCAAGIRDRVQRDGWWRTAGRSWQWLRAPQGIVRLYLNVEFPALPAVIRRVTDALADETEPWLLKCAVDPAVHARTDAVVAYLPLDVVQRRADQLYAIPGTDASVREDHPPLTLPVAAGIAAAYDPGGDESFGTHRCRLITEAVEHGEATVDGIVEYLAHQGIDEDRPWARRDDPRLPWET